MPRLSAVSELTVTGKLSITSTQDVSIPVTPNSPNSIYRPDEYEALKESWRALYLNINTKEKAVLRQFMVKMSHFPRKPGKKTVLMDEQKYICQKVGMKIITNQ